MEMWSDPDATEQVEAFMADLPDAHSQPTRAIMTAVDEVARRGPVAGRPLVAEVALEPDYRQYIPLFGRHLKEIRPLSTSVRILCTFTPDRRLLLLYAGDKAGDWNRWYRTAIAEAARLYADYRREMGY